MRTLSKLRLLATAVILPTVAACEAGSAPRDVQSAALGGSCNISLTYVQPKFLSVSANSSDNYAGWFIKNNGSSAVTLTSQTPSHSGNVTAVHTTTWVIFPHTLDPAEQIDADVFFDAGAAGSGSVGLSLSSSCGTLNFPTHPVTIN